MYLVYLDESGQSGNNLTDTQQPVFVLAAMPVPESSWLAVEAAFQALIDQFFPPPRADRFEIHATELINARNHFRAFPVKHRLDFVHACFELAADHKLRILHRAIVKKRFLHWLNNTFGAGVVINPHVAAFALVSQVVKEFLKTNSSLGIFISDENKEVMHDVDKSVRLLRGDKTSLRLSHIIEKCFFIDSDKSLLLQLCDLCAYALRKFEEEKAGLPIKPLDRQLIPWAKPLIHRGNESMPDVLAWLEQVQKKERPGNNLGNGKGPNRSGR